MGGIIYNEKSTQKAVPVLASIVVLALVATNSILPAFAGVSCFNTNKYKGDQRRKANTPIQHVVVIFQENESFDHYFGTYPVATNPAGEPPLYAAPGTPTVNGLTAALLTNNPNSANPQRLDRSQAWTKDMDHGYTAEQKSFDGGLMDKFVENDGHGDPMVMDYFDGNTVTAWWNYAQHYAHERQLLRLKLRSFHSGCSQCCFRQQRAELLCIAQTKHKAAQY